MIEILENKYYNNGSLVGAKGCYNITCILQGVGDGNRQKQTERQARQSCQTREGQDGHKVPDSCNAVTVKCWCYILTERDWVGVRCVPH